MDHFKVLIESSSDCSVSYHGSVVRIFQLPVSFATVMCQGSLGDGAGRREILRLAKTMDMLLDSDCLSDVNECYFITVQDILSVGYQVRDIDVLVVHTARFLSTFNIEGSGNAGVLSVWDGVTCDSDGTMHSLQGGGILEYCYTSRSLFEQACRQISKEKIPASVLKSFEISEEYDFEILPASDISSNLSEFVDENIGMRCASPMKVDCPGVIHDISSKEFPSDDVFVQPFLGGTWCNVKFDRTDKYNGDVVMYDSDEGRKWTGISFDHVGQGIVGGFYFQREIHYYNKPGRVFKKFFQPCCFVSWTMKGKLIHTYSFQERVAELRRINITMNYEVLGGLGTAFAPTHPQLSTLLARTHDEFSQGSWNGVVVNAQGKVSLIPLLKLVTHESSVNTILNTFQKMGLHDRMPYPELNIKEVSGESSFYVCQNISDAFRHCDEWSNMCNDGVDQEIAPGMKQKQNYPMYTQSYEGTKALVFELWRYKNRNLRQGFLKGPLDALLEDGPVGVYWFIRTMACGYIVRRGNVIDGMYRFVACKEDSKRSHVGCKECGDKCRKTLIKYDKRK